MEIIELKPWELNRSCRCGTKVKIHIADVRYWTKFDYGGGSEYGYDWICPSCRHDNNIYYRDVPGSVRRAAEKTWKANGEQMLTEEQMIRIGKGYQLELGKN